MRLNQLLLFLSVTLVFQISCSKIDGLVRINYTKAEAIYGNLDSLRSTPLVEEGRPVTQAVGHFIGTDYILIGERSTGIHVFDNTNMRNPQNIAFLNIPFCNEFYADGDYLYAESGYDLLKINIKDIRNPFIQYRLTNAYTDKVYKNAKGDVLLGFNYVQAIDEFEVNSPEAKEIKRQGELHVDYNNQMIPLSTVPAMFAGNNGKSKGTINRIGLYYNHIYVVGNDRLHIFESNGGSISKRSSMEVDEQSETVYIDRDRLYIGSADMVRIYSLQNRSNPRLASRVEHSTSCDPVLADGEVAYSTLRSVSNEGCAGSENILMVLRVRSADRARKLKDIEMKSPYGMAMINDHLFVGEGANGLTIFNVKDKESPDEVKNNREVVAFDVMHHPIDPNIIILTNNNGLKEYNIDWETLKLAEVGSLQYK